MKIEFLLKALHYDIRRGPHSVGSHVRDAAAYVCWAFGRAYCNEDMKNILDQLAPHLLTVACYDREVSDGYYFMHEFFSQICESFNWYVCSYDHFFVHLRLIAGEPLQLLFKRMLEDKEIT